jgi:hypothetical protein
MKEGLPRLFANWGMLFTGFAVIGIMLQIFVSHSVIYWNKGLVFKYGRQDFWRKEIEW